jgi:hypothetical protein
MNADGRFPSSRSRLEVDEQWEEGGLSVPGNILAVEDQRSRQFDWPLSSVSTLFSTIAGNASGARGVLFK